MSKFERWRNKLLKPVWLTKSPTDSLNGLYDAVPLLFEKGRVAFGYLVQANSLLFKTSSYSYPACFIYSEDLFFQNNPEMLESISHELYEYKSSDAIPNHLKQVVNIIKDEYERAYNILLPENFTYGKVVYLTTVLVDPRHIPKYKITRSDMPLLVLPEQTPYSIILPKYYWVD
ncbi:MAG: hypothetical protein GX136_04995 [Clostridiales bacterium]|jgi:hypothetical protein|nr:hypothetical protein [Clostridiales bacterium]